MSQEHVTCTNCEQEYQKGFKFCPHCGQKSDDELTLGVLFYNTISNYFSFDARFIKGFIPLMFRPGFLPKKFVEGKRLLYLHPGQMYLFVAFIFFFVFSFSIRKQTQSINKSLQDQKLTINGGNVTIDKEPVDSVKLEQALKPFKDNADLLGLKEEDVKAMDSIVKSEASKPKNANMSFDFDEKKVDSLLEAGASNKEIYAAMGMDDDAGFFTRKFYGQMLKFYKDKGLGSIFQTFYDSLPIALFFLLPIFALILKLLYYKRGRYSHHLVFSLYFFSYLFTAFMLLYLINMIVNIPNWIDFLIVLSTFFYLWIAVKRFYRSGWILSFIKSGIATFIFLIMVAPMAAGIVLLFSFMFY
ncbi:DUF3667 domain-containing protein [Winogradskyella sp. 3972H.M.0a.05]|uniref:DUF3667 domain-containing protein n=1 Tax=Winogradskyella sp. 3972H.M.0a.05 TaxID=2950277 RepID=UPI0033938917